MDYVLYKLILGNKDKTDLQFIVQLLELSEKVFKTALSKKHKISHRLILRQWPRYYIYLTTLYVFSFRLQLHNKDFIINEMYVKRQLFSK